MEPPSWPLVLFSFTKFSIGDLISLIILLSLLFILSLISGSQTAYLMLTESDLSKLKKKRPETAARITKLFDKPDYLFATFLLLILLVSTAIVLLTDSLLASFINFYDMPLTAFSIRLIFSAFLLLLFGEYIPKLWAQANPVTFACSVSQTLNLLVSITKPLTFFIIKPVGKLVKHYDIIESQVDIDSIMEDLNENSDTEIIPSTNDRKMLQAVVDSTSTEVKEVMTPRIDITAVGIDTKFCDLCDVVVDWAYSRIPVYEETLDNVKGVLYVKDLLPYINKHVDFNWQQLIRAPYFIPEAKKINDLLSEFKNKKMHMAIVVDEYGGTSGIVTLEDILEEIVGEIFDESDLEEDESLYTQIDDNTFLFEGKTPLNDFCKIMQIDSDFFEDEKGEAETLAGFILELKGYFPQKGESVKYAQFLFEVENADHRRIHKIKVTVNDEDEGEE